MINVVCGIRSTGRICTDLATALEEQGHEVKIAYGREEVPEQFQKYAIRIGNDLDVKLHGIKARLFDGCGFGSRRDTIKFIEWVKEYNPDIIHLHNIHGYYINIEILFDYLKTCEKRIIWTLHDCWAFTGHAAFCEAANCKKWITGCGRCPKKKEYPSSIIDLSEKNWKRKKEIFECVPNMTVVCPSKWLANLVKQSFLSEYPVEVIYNGVDINTFSYNNDSKLKDELGITNNKVILGVASVWEPRKGLNDFIKLREILDEEYKIVLVGLTKKQIDMLPEGILGICRTNSSLELVRLYSLADVFVNPTYEDNYPSTNLEAISCNTPIITYNTGGSPESALLYGYVVEKGDVEAIAKIVKKHRPEMFDEIELRNSICINCMVERYLDFY